MKLHCLTRIETENLLVDPTRCGGWAILPEALPPPVVLAATLPGDQGGWRWLRLFVDETTRNVVGAGCFKSEPQARRVEIGYGVSSACRGQGHATAGVRLLVAEALASGAVDAVGAATLPGNRASQRVLAKAGFVRDGCGLDEEGPVERWLWSRR